MRHNANLITATDGRTDGRTAGGAVVTEGMVEEWGNLNGPGGPHDKEKMMQKERL